VFAQQKSPNDLLTAEFALCISAKEYIKYYRRQVNWVLVKSNSGLTIRFPASLLSAFVTHHGVHGQFILTYYRSGKVCSLNKQ
jgi:hypothetical protein